VGVVKLLIAAALAWAIVWAVPNSIGAALLRRNQETGLHFLRRWHWYAPYTIVLLTGALYWWLRS
jgi:hypothetical protein